MKYVALLRGINVGGVKVEMPKLKAAFEKAGCQNVTTYINSGNVLFEDGRESKTLEKVLEEAIAQDFGLTVPIVLRDAPTIKKLVEDIPGSWTNDDKQKTDVLFLWDEINSPQITERALVNSPAETVKYYDGSIVWNVPRQHIEPGQGLKFTEPKLQKLITARNINTVRKLYELLRDS